MAKVLGIGGIFFKADDPERLLAWYREHLGLEPEAFGGVMFPTSPEKTESGRGYTLWVPFKRDTDYFDPSPAPFMVNFRVDDLDAIVGRLGELGAPVDDRIEVTEQGKFAWVMDPEGNRVELWEPVAEPPPGDEARYLSKSRS